MTTARTLTVRPEWSTWRGAVATVMLPSHLRKTVSIALAVGTILLAINQLDVLLSGRATLLVVGKILLTYIVPFCVSNYGILVATHVRHGQHS